VIPPWQVDQPRAWKATQCRGWCTGEPEPPFQLYYICYSQKYSNMWIRSKQESKKEQRNTSYTTEVPETCQSLTLVNLLEWRHLQRENTSYREQESAKVKLPHAHTLWRWVEWHTEETGNSCGIWKYLIWGQSHYRRIYRIFLLVRQETRITLIDNLPENNSSPAHPGDEPGVGISLHPTTQTGVRKTEHSAELLMGVY
jgi:hypothetical protein